MRYVKDNYDYDPEMQNYEDKIARGDIVAQRQDNKRPMRRNAY